MPRCCQSVFPCVLLSVLFLPSPAVAGDLLDRLTGYHFRHPPEHLGNPRQIAAAAPAPHLYGEYNVNRPWYGYGFGVPSYRWGYFGAHYRPVCNSHTGYYGDFTQWSYRRGY